MFPPGMQWQKILTQLFFNPCCSAAPKQNTGNQVWKNFFHIWSGSESELPTPFLLHFWGTPADESCTQQDEKSSWLGCPVVMSSPGAYTSSLLACRTPVEPWSGLSVGRHIKQASASALSTAAGASLLAQSWVMGTSFSQVSWLNFGFIPIWGTREALLSHRLLNYFKIYEMAGLLPAWPFGSLWHPEAILNSRYPLSFPEPCSPQALGTHRGYWQVSCMYPDP